MLDKRWVSGSRDKKNTKLHPYSDEAAVLETQGSVESHAFIAMTSMMDCFGFFVLVWFGFMPHQSLQVINTKSIFIYIKSTISNNLV